MLTAPGASLGRGPTKGIGTGGVRGGSRWEPSCKESCSSRPRGELVDCGLEGATWSFPAPGGLHAFTSIHCPAAPVAGCVARRPHRLPGRSSRAHRAGAGARFRGAARASGLTPRLRLARRRLARSEEHTSELQSRENLVCRLLLEKKKVR